MHICDHCLFSYACCLGTPTYQMSITKGGFVLREVDDCDAFVEHSDSININVDEVEDEGDYFNDDFL